MEYSASVEQELFLHYAKTKDRKLLDEIMEQYSYIADILARRFDRKGLEFDDIYQSACIGLMNAARRFDPQRGTRFVTFATPTVLGEIKRLFRDKGNCIRVPRRMYEIFSKANKLRNEELVLTGKMPSRTELSKALGITKEQLAQAMYWGDTQEIRSLEQPVDEQDILLSDCIGVEDNEFLMIENRDFIDSFLSTLTEQEQKFVHLRFHEELSQSKIANLLETSQMNISRMEKRVIEKLREFYRKSLSDC